MLSNHPVGENKISNLDMPGHWAFDLDGTLLDYFSKRKNYFNVLLIALFHINKAKVLRVFVTTHRALDTMEAFYKQKIQPLFEEISRDPNYAKLEQNPRYYQTHYAVEALEELTDRKDKVDVLTRDDFLGFKKKVRFEDRNGFKVLKKFEQSNFDKNVFKLEDYTREEYKDLEKAGKNKNWQYRLLADEIQKAMSPDNTTKQPLRVFEDAKDICLKALKYAKSPYWPKMVPLELYLIDLEDKKIFYLQLSESEELIKTEIPIEDIINLLPESEKSLKEELHQFKARLTFKEFMLQLQMKKDQEEFAIQQKVELQKAELQRAEQQRADQQREEQQREEQQREEQQREEQQREEQQREEQQREEQQREEQQREEQQRDDQQREEQQREEQRRVEQQRAEQQKAEQQKAKQGLGLTEPLLIKVKKNEVAEKKHQSPTPLRSNTVFKKDVKNVNTDCLLRLIETCCPVSPSLSSANGVSR